MDTSKGPLATFPRPSALGRDGWGQLFGIVGDALRDVPPLYLSSIFGLPWTWLPPHDRYSEFRILDVWRVERALRYVIESTLPAIPRTPPPYGPPLLTDLVWRPTVVLQRPDHRGNYTTYPDEAWFFINGIMTNDGVAHLNAAYLADLFHRPITIIQNSTGGILSDLVECALGKQRGRATESVGKAFPAIYDALKSEKERVVVVAHSQGTIIVSVVLRLLQESLRLGTRRRAPGRARAAGQPEPVAPHDWPIVLEQFEPVTEGELAKLEIYAMANCATVMRYVEPRAATERPIPWIESFGNEYDIVARLGMLAPYARERGLSIAGPRYMRPGGWGHLLNDHYLRVIDDGQRDGYRRGGRKGAAPYVLLNHDAPHDETPRLFSYLNGGTPPAATGEIGSGRISLSAIS